MDVDSAVKRIRELHEHLQLLLEAREPIESDSKPDSNAAITSDRSDAMPHVSSILSSLVQRDDQIRGELMKLQRTLSRQTFRGAESARRLVRKLSRKAGQNVDEARAYLLAFKNVGANVEQQPPLEGTRNESTPASRPDAERSFSSPLNSTE